MEGLARCSRPFPLASGGARLVTMQLGPGYLRGDRFACAGTVGARAELAVSPQAATRALGRGKESVASAVWHVGEGGTLRLIGEPLVLYADAQHRADTEIELEPGATLVYLDVIVASAAFVSVTTRLRVRTAQRLLLHDTLTFGPELTKAVGTAFLVVADGVAEINPSKLSEADAAGYDAGRRYGVRIGVGRPACGGIALRAVGTNAFSVQAALCEVIDRIQAERQPVFRINV